MQDLAFESAKQQMKAIRSARSLAAAFMAANPFGAFFPRAIKMALKTLAIISLSCFLAACGGNGDSRETDSRNSVIRYNEMGVVVRPHEDYALLEWIPRNSADIRSITVEVLQDDQVTATHLISDTAVTSFRVPGLTTNTSYRFRITFTYSDSSIGYLNSNIKPITMGTNSDNDRMRDEEDPDDDNDGAIDSIDLDSDGDRLIEIRTQRELDQMRFVLNGTGRRTAANEPVNTTGCEYGCQGYELVNDIILVLEDPAGWQPIGNITEVKDRFSSEPLGFSSQSYCEGDTFNAIFEGNGRTISNLQINRPDQNCIGLFAKVTNEIRNLNIQATKIIGKNLIGVLAGDASFAKIIASHTSTKIVEGFGNSSIGGLVGTIQNGSISHSSAQTGSLSHKRFRVGGLAGDIFHTDISDSHAFSINITAGKMMADQNTVTGGFVGWCYNSTISNSFSITDNIRSLADFEDQMVGGFAGFCGGRITDSYAITGTITGQSNMGGLVGQNSGPLPQGDHLTVINSYALTEQITGVDCIGGLIGIGNDSTILSSYAITGAMAGLKEEVAGLLGSFGSGLLSRSYAISGRISGKNNIGGLIGAGSPIDNIVSSYAIAHTLQGSEVGGLIGTNYGSATLTSSYAIAANISSETTAGGLIGNQENVHHNNNTIKIISSYAVADATDGGHLTELIGHNETAAEIQLSYWDGSLMDTHADFTDSNNRTVGDKTGALYLNWIHNDTLGDRAVWCDENQNNRIEESEKREDNRIWEFGADNQYPIIRCTPPNPLGLSQERWRALNGQGNVPDSAELIGLIRDFRSQQKEKLTQRFRNRNLHFLIRPHHNRLILEWAFASDQDISKIEIQLRQKDQTIATYTITDPATTSFQVANLNDNSRYTARMVFVYSDNSIAILEKTDITTGINSDNDTLINEKDSDDDNDNLLDSHPIEQSRNQNNVSCAILTDCDGDTLSDNHPTELLLNQNNTACALLPDCDGDTLKDNHTTELLLNQNDMACALLPDCDGDGTSDNLDAFPIDPTETTDTDGDRIGNNKDTDDDNDSLADDNSKELLFNQGGVACALLADCDNDGTHDNDDLDSDSDHLIEIQTQQELSQIRYALDGTGRRIAANQPINTNGCQNCRGYELINNITLSGPTSWQPIGENQCNANLTAVFEGNHFTIANLSIHRPEQNCVGLFAAVSSEIRNLNLHTNQIQGGNLTAALVGYAPDARIHNVHISAGNIQGQDAVGGLIGKARQTNITQSSAITSHITGQQKIGGLIGQADDTSAQTKVLNSIAITGKLSGRNSGGIAGAMNGQIIASYAITHSIESPSQAGGLIALATEPTHILSSYAVTSNTSAATNLGGLIGLSRNSISITTSYALVSNGSATNLGGLIGQNQTTTNIQSSYWDSSLSPALAGPGSPQPTTFLQADIADWNNATIGPDNAVWCDTNHNFIIEDSEKTSANFIWNFGENNQYPIIACTTPNLLGLSRTR